MTPTSTASMKPPSSAENCKGGGGCLQRIIRRRARGCRMPPNTMSVTRPGPWGNLFKVTGDMTPEHAVADFRLELRYEAMAIELKLPVRSKHMRWIAEHITELKGKKPRVLLQGWTAMPRRSALEYYQRMTPNDQAQVQPPTQ